MTSKLIMSELERVISALDEKDIAHAASLIEHSNQVFVAGAGRSGLMGKGFAMRLSHLGVRTYVVGETTTPGIGSNDLLILCTGSGETKSLISMAEKAKSLGAKVLVLTIKTESSAAKLADGIIHIQAQAKEEQGMQQSLQPMGSLFEQALLITLDSLVLTLMRKLNVSPESMFSRHANLE
ncbi:6-phospho-3-hexuloisomerase [Neobacillus mesonae]|nr:6-phospho-3-hexuloisomerase [Neobacillus mesonae]